MSSLMISNSIKKRESFTGSRFQQSIKLIANGLVALYIIIRYCISCG